MRRTAPALLAAAVIAMAYAGPSTLRADTASVTEVKNAGDFEAMLTWAVGVRAQEPFRVDALDNPPRLVVDIAH